MEITGTREAFRALINIRGIYKIIGVDRSTVAGWKTRLTNEEGLTSDKMEEVLSKAGLTYKDEPVWQFPEGMLNFKIAMFDFHRQVAQAEIGTEITVDYLEGALETIVNNSLNRAAIRLGCIVYRDDTKRPTVHYSFRL